MSDPRFAATTGQLRRLTTALAAFPGEPGDADRIARIRALEELVARETIWLSREQRAVVDAELAPRLGRLGDRKVEAEAKRSPTALTRTARWLGCAAPKPTVA